ncbi:20180_t:CDS:1, partial [Gigaspora rosea]
MLNETALPSNYKILDKTSLSSNSDDEIQHNIQSNNITEINLEGSITDIT